MRRRSRGQGGIHAAWVGRSTSQVRVIVEDKSVCTVDGDNGLGLVVGPKAMRIAIERASEVRWRRDGPQGRVSVLAPATVGFSLRPLVPSPQYGSGWVSVQNTNHYGIAGFYSMMALEKDMIGFSMTNTTKLVAPLWGAERMLGTNPIAIAVPAGEEPPMVVDMATSAAAYGKVEIAERLGKKIPYGWCIDKEGNVRVCGWNGDTLRGRKRLSGGVC